MNVLSEPFKIVYTLLSKKNNNKNKELCMYLMTVYNTILLNLYNVCDKIKIKISTKEGKK